LIEKGIILIKNKLDLIKKFKFKAKFY